MSVLSVFIICIFIVCTYVCNLLAQLGLEVGMFDGDPSQVQNECAARLQSGHQFLATALHHIFALQAALAEGDAQTGHILSRVQ